jgi:hypothetical protein
MERAVSMKRSCQGLRRERGILHDATRPKRRYTSQSTKPPELKFRALLTDGVQEVHFQRVATDRMLRN